MGPAGAGKTLLARAVAGQAGVFAHYAEREFSEETAREIDCAVRELITTAFGEAMRTLRTHRGALDAGAKLLLVKETLTRGELLPHRGAQARGSRVELGAPMTQGGCGQLHDDGGGVLPMSRVASLLIKAALGAVVLIVLTATPGLAWHRHPGVFIDVGPIWWGPPYPYWAYYPPYYWYPPPTVIVQEPPVYIQQPPPASPAPALPPPPEGPYWYYCPSARAYYPTAPQCPEPWVKVPPRPE